MLEIRGIHNEETNFMGNYRDFNHMVSYINSVVFLFPRLLT